MVKDALDLTTVEAAFPIRSYTLTMAFDYKQQRVKLNWQAPSIRALVQDAIHAVETHRETFS